MNFCLNLHQVIAPAALFLAAKVEEQPRKLEHVIKVAHACLNPQEPSPDVRSDVSVQKHGSQLASHHCVSREPGVRLLCLEERARCLGLLPNECPILPSVATKNIVVVMELWLVC